MVRWEPNACARLQEAALALFEEHGCDDTTVADIAAAAGLTERTFFRYFSDKREVLFVGSSALVDLMVEAVAGAPADASPREAVRAALVATDGFFEGRRPYARRRSGVLAANPILLERELRKLASLTGSLALALRARGTTEPTATLTAEVGVLVFRLAFARWLEHGGSLARLVDTTYGEVEAVVGP